MASELRGYGEPDRLYDGSHPLRECDPSDKYISDDAATPRTLEIRHAQAEHDARIPGTFVGILCDKGTTNGTNPFLTISPWHHPSRHAP